MKLVTLMLPEAYMESLDELVGRNMYSSRSAAIRYAVMDLLKRELWRQEREAKQERKKADEAGFQKAKKKKRRKTVQKKKRTKAWKNWEFFKSF